MKMSQRVKMKTIGASVRKHNFEPFLLGYTKEEAIKEANRCLQCKSPKCMLEGCPVNNKIPEILKAVREDKLELAFNLISEKSIMPNICSIVCPHEKQCEGSCTRGIKGDPVAIGSIENFVSRWARENGLKPSLSDNLFEKKVLCIGSGPASIACAKVLAQNGVKVHIAEENEYFGGVLAWGIPSYRLERKAIDDIKEELTSLGVSFEFSKRVRDIKALSNSYDAIFIGTGAQLPSYMGIKGEELKGVFTSKEYLEKINLSPLKDGKRYFDGSGKNVLIVGGGNVAMDAARDAVRLPQTENVYIAYRRSLNEMPANKDELKYAMEEGIKLLELRNPVEFLGDDYIEKVKLSVMKLGEPDESGRRRPVESGETEMLDIDTVVLCVGFSSDKSFNEVNAILMNKRGYIVTDEEQRTSQGKVFAGGDAVTGANTVVAAMKSGMDAAKAILKMIMN